MNGQMLKCMPIGRMHQDSLSQSGVQRIVALTTKLSNLYMMKILRNWQISPFGIWVRDSRVTLSQFARQLGKITGLRLPMLPTSRSLNLSNSVAITLFEVWRQQGFGDNGHSIGYDNLVPYDQNNFKIYKQFAVL